MALSSARSWAIRIVLLALALLSLAILAGASYQAIAWRADDQRFRRPGRLVSAGEFRLNLYCTGQGSPAVVLESGLADSLDTWRHVQPEIARFSRVCSYDRAGYGYSDPGPMLEQATGSHRNCTQRSNRLAKSRLIYWSAIRSVASTCGSSTASTRTKWKGSFWSTPHRRISTACSRRLRPAQQREVSWPFSRRDQSLLNSRLGRPPIRNVGTSDSMLDVRTCKSVPQRKQPVVTIAPQAARCPFRTVCASTVQGSPRPSAPPAV